MILTITVTFIAVASLFVLSMFTLGIILKRFPLQNNSVQDKKQ